MLSFITDHIPTLTVGLILAVLAAIAVYVMIRDRKRGKSSCGGSCRGCPMSGRCNREK